MKKILSFSNGAKLFAIKIVKFLLVSISFCAFSYGWFKELSSFNSLTILQTIILVAIVLIPIGLYLFLQSLQEKLEKRPW